MKSSTVYGGRTIAAGALARAVTLAIVAGSLCNLAIYFLVPVLFNFSLEIPLGGAGAAPAPLPVTMVLLATIVPTLGAALLLAALDRFTRRPVTIFRAVSLVVLLLSLGGPLSSPVALGIRLTLAALHVTTATIVVYTLTRHFTAWPATGRGETG